MKRQVLGMFALCLLVLGLTVPQAVAQAPSKPAFSIVANIPWEFMVENKTLPAGKYEFRQTVDKPNEWTLANAKGEVRLVFGTEPAEMMNPPKKFEAVFDAVGGQHFLVALWLESGDGFSVPLTTAEKDVIKGGAKPNQEKVPMVKK